MNNQPTVYKINTNLINKIKEKIEKINRKAVKLGKSEIVLNLLDTETVVNEDRTVTTFQSVEIIGEDPTIADWKFMATIQHTEIGNIIRSYLGDMPEGYRDADPYCEHCGSVRKRSDTYIIYNIHTEKYKQVGRNCLVEFIGDGGVSGMLKYFELLNELDEFIKDTVYFGGGGRPSNPEEQLYDLEYFLAYVVECVERWGYVNRDRATTEERLTTGEVAWNEMMASEELKSITSLKESSYENARKAIEWSKALWDSVGLNDYLHNISIIANRGTVDYRTKGYAASIIPTYYREVEKELEEQRKREQGLSEADSEYFGIVKKREVFTLTVEKVISFESDFGYMYIYKMVDEQGNIAIWKTTSSLDLEEGETYDIRATVKDHTVYNGVKQTVLTRCAIA